MLSSLRSRLLASYLFLAVIVLIILGAALLILLLRFPMPTRQVYTRLVQALDSAQPTLPANGQDLENHLHQEDQAFGLRFLVVDRQGAVLADSRPDQGTPTNLRRVALPLLRSRLGTFQDPQGREWLFAAQPFGGKDLLLAAELQTQGSPPSVLGDELLPVFLEAGCAAFLLSLVLAWLISRWVSRPLRQLAMATQQVADGDFEQKVPREGPEEIRELEASFQEMTRRVQSGLKSQEELLANVSHELRTPLTSIRGFSQAILDGTAGSPEAVHQAAGVIQQESERLQRLVEGLLDLARAEAGLAGIQRRRMDLGPEIQAALERFQPRARDGGIHLTAQIDPLPPVMADSDRMAQVFDNLLDNAVRHTPAGGSVVLRAWPLQAEVHIQVRDTGPGIPSEALPRLFQRFFRAERGGRGAGLGLAICKEIVQAHRGTIEAGNDPSGGAVFTVHLPIAPPEGTTLVIRRRRS